MKKDARLRKRSTSASIAKGMVSQRRRQSAYIRVLYIYIYIYIYIPYRTPSMHGLRTQFHKQTSTNKAIKKQRERHKPHKNKEPPINNVPTETLNPPQPPTNRGCRNSTHRGQRPPALKNRRTNSTQQPPDVTDSREFSIYYRIYGDSETDDDAWEASGDEAE